MKKGKGPDMRNLEAHAEMPVLEHGHRLAVRD